jgi:Na+-driven multidrug efflux pump
VGYRTRKYEFYRFGKGEFRYEGEKAKLILKLGIPTMIQMCIVSGGNVLIQRVVNDLGTSAIAANTAAGRIEGYLFVPAQGLNNGISTFSGQNMGAGLPDRVRSGRRKARSILVPVAVVLAIFLFIFARQLIALFGVEGEALELGIVHLKFIAPFFAFFCLYMSNAGVLTGTGDVKAASAVTLAVLTVRVALTYLFCYAFHMGFAALYVSNPIGWVFGLVISFLRFRGGKWESMSVVKRGSEA